MIYPDPKPSVPAEFFQLLLDKLLLHKILCYTNDYAAKLHHNKPQPRRSVLNQLKPFSMTELHQFLELSLLMGNIQMPSLKHYWRKKNVLYTHPVFGETMSRNRYLLLLRSLRFYDTNKTTQKRKKIQPVITHITKNFRKYYSPKKELSIDEAVLGFKGRLSYKQYIPMKRSRFGIKLYELSSSTGYVLKIIMYTGKGTIEDESKKGHGYQVVKRLLRGYQHKGHTLYVDNFYTSINLAEDLFSKGT